MFCKTFFNISNNGKFLLPSVHSRVSRCYAAQGSANGGTNGSAKNDECDKKPKADRFALNKELEKAINDQINKELASAFANLAMASYYDKKNVALPGFAQNHSCHVKTEISHAKMLIAILSLRGGNLTLKTVEPPKTEGWKAPLDVVKFALQSEKGTAEGLMDLLNQAAKVQDHHVSNIIGSSMMGDQMKIVAELEQRLGKLSVCATPECLSTLDNALLKAKKSKK